MKQIYFITLLLCITVVNVYAQHSDQQLIRARVLSEEEMTITGTFIFNLEVVAYDTCTLDSIRILNDGGYFTVYYNSSSSLMQSISTPAFNQNYLLPGDTAICTITVTHSTQNIPYYPEAFGLLISAHKEDEISKSMALCKVYFTPYNSVEIWDKKDFSRQPRIWATRTSPEPQRVFIPRDSIPVSTKPINDTIQYDWQKYYQVARVQGLPYLIQMAAVHPDTIKFYKDKDSIEVWQGQHNGQLGKTWFGNTFSGTITGRLRASYVPDGQTDPIDMGLEGVLVAAYDEDLTYDDKLGHTHTNASGEFTITYSKWQSPLEGSNIELFIQYWSENLTYDIEVEIDPYWSWVPILFNVAPETGYIWIGDVGTSYTGNLSDLSIENIYDGAFKTLNWAYKAYKFSKDNLGSLSGGFTRSLDILTETNGDASYFNSFYGNRVNLSRNNDLHEGTIWHEFGHFLMHQLQNGYDPGNTTGVHYIDEPAHLNLAFSEGWAEGFSRIVDAHYRYYDIESEYRKLGGYFGIHYNWENPNISYLGENGFKSEYLIACTILDLYDGPGKFLNLPNIETTAYNDANTNKGYKSISPPEQDNVSLSFEVICKAMLFQDHVGQFYAELQNQQTEGCIRKEIQRVFTLNGITNPVNSYNVQAHHLNSDAFYTVAQTDGRDFYMDVDYINEHFNYGAFSSNADAAITDGITIGSSGKIGINADMPSGYSGPYPDQNSTMVVSVCNNNTVTIQNGGIIEIGGTLRNGVLEIKNGSVLLIEDNGQLIVNSGNKIVIENGAKIFFEQGADVNLAANAHIEIQDGGLIEIGNGATFTWSGKGYLKVNNDPYDLGKVNIKAAAGATNAKFIKQGEWVSGEGYIEKLIEVETGTLSFDRSIAEVNVKYGVIELGHEAFVDVEPICYFNNVTFQSNESNQMHNGLWVYGQQNTPYVSGCLFKNALRGITVYPLVKGVGVTLGNEPISYKSVITNTVFKDCHQSIYINARGAEITNCQITGIGDHPGVRLRGIQYKSFIDKLTAKNQAIGIDLLGSGQNEVSVRRSNIHNNGTAGIYGTNVKLSLGCDKIYENYSTSFQGQNIWLANGSHFIAQNTLSNGSRLNDLHSTNSTSVFVDNVFGIHIDNGFNNFVSNGYAIWGSIIPYQVTNNPSQYESIKVVYGQNNYWNTQGASPQFGDYAVVYNDGWTNYLTHIDDIGQSLSTAPNLPENCPYGTISNDPPSMFLGKAPLFDPNGVPLDEVWLEARDFMNEGNFSQAYDRFNDIVSYNYDTSFTMMGSSDIYTSEFREWYDVIQMAYSKMIECINQSVALGQINANTYELDGIFGVQDNLLAKLGSNDTLNTELKFEYNFDKAMLYRLTNKQTLCLTKITNMLSHAHISAHNIKLLNYYACLVEKENRMLNDSTLTKAEYFQVFDCDTFLEIPNLGPPDYQEEKTGVAENTQSIANQEINLYPNPANDYLFVSLVKPASNIQINVFDLMGKLIVSKEIKENTQLIQMPLDISNGSYIMQITTDNYTARKRFMVVK